MCMSSASPPLRVSNLKYCRHPRRIALSTLRILICVNGVLKHVNTPDSYLRERCANIGDSVRSLA